MTKFKFGILSIILIIFVILNLQFCFKKESPCIWQKEVSDIVCLSQAELIIHQVTDNSYLLPDELEALKVVDQLYISYPVIFSKETECPCINFRLSDKGQPTDIYLAIPISKRTYQNYSPETVSEIIWHECLHIAHMKKQRGDITFDVLINEELSTCKQEYFYYSRLKSLGYLNGKPKSVAEKELLNDIDFYYRLYNISPTMWEYQLRPLISFSTLLHNY